jgi:hypothetical protein
VPGSIRIGGLYYPISTWTWRAAALAGDTAKTGKALNPLSPQSCRIVSL